MTREELHTLVDAQFDNLELLQKEDDFMIFEQTFSKIWTTLGGDVLQATVGKAPKNPKKKHLPNPIRRGRIGS